MAILKSVPTALLKGLPKSDKEAIIAIVGESIALIGRDSNDNTIELEFVDKHGDTHNIWVEESFVTLENGEK